MKKGNDLRTLIIIVLCIAVVSISIGYAALNQNLKINTNATVVGSSWVIEFENLTGPVMTGSASVNNEATLNATTIAIDVSLIKPGDSVVYTFDVANNGDIDAKLSAEPTITGTDVAALNNIQYSLTYDDGSTINAEDTLNKDDTKKLKLAIMFDPEAESVNAQDVTLNIEATLLYIQK